MMKTKIKNKIFHQWVALSTSSSVVITVLTQVYATLRYIRVVESSILIFSGFCYQLNFYSVLDLPDSYWAWPLGSKIFCALITHRFNGLPI